MPMVPQPVDWEKCSGIENEPRPSTATPPPAIRRDHHRGRLDDRLGHLHRAVDHGPVGRRRRGCSSACGSSAACSPCSARSPARSWPPCIRMPGDSTSSSARPTATSGRSSSAGRSSWSSRTASMPPWRLPSPSTSACWCPGSARPTCWRGFPWANCCRWPPRPTCPTACSTSNSTRPNWWPAA